MSWPGLAHGFAGQVGSGSWLEPRPGTTLAESSYNLQSHDIDQHHTHIGRCGGWWQLETSYNLQSYDIDHHIFQLKCDVNLCCNFVNGNYFLCDTNCHQLLVTLGVGDMLISVI